MWIVLENNYSLKQHIRRIRFSAPYICDVECPQQSVWSPKFGSQHDPRYQFPSMEDKIRGNRLRWVVHVYSRLTDAVVRKGMGKPKLTLEVVAQKDLGLLNIMEHDTLDRA